MKKLLILAGMFAACVGVARAQAPVDAPSLQYFVGPSIGNKWHRVGTFNGGFNAQTGTTYTITRFDIGKWVVTTNAASIATTLPQAGTSGFEANRCFDIVNTGAGTNTITPTTSTINGAATLALAQGVGARVCSDGTNWWAH